MKTLLLAGLLLNVSTAAFAAGVDAERVVYAKPDGAELPATLFLPDGEATAPRPAIVLIHGGAWLTGSRIQMRWYGRAFASRGYVALAISYRTMPAYAFPAPVEDAKAAVRWLRLNAAEYNVDPDKIAAMGTSAGGHLALMLAVTDAKDGLDGTENSGVSSKVEAAVSLYGPSDLRGFETKTKDAPLGGSAFRRPYLQSFLGDKPFGQRNPEEAASPIVYVTAQAPPLLLIQGTEDDLVPCAETERLFSRLEEVGAPATLLKVEGYGHAFDHLHHGIRDDVFGKIISFLGKSLGLS